MSAFSWMEQTRTRGAAMGLGSAALFGVSAPVAKSLLLTSGPLTLAALLYLGAGLGLLLLAPLWPRPGRIRGRAVGAVRRAEAPLGASDLPLILGGVVTGGILGPLLLMVGLQRVSAVSGSLLLNLEPPLTIVLAVALFGEHLGARQAGAAALILVGAAVVVGRTGDLRSEWTGVLAIAGACLSWAIDTNLSQRMSLRDPVAFSRLKGLAGGTCTLLLARAFGERLPPAGVIGVALAIGAVCYGLSAVLFVRALRDLGAARVAAYFAMAPFFGVLAALPILGERLRASDIGAMAVMATGVAMLLRERHDHPHQHEAIEHDHAHVHDDHHRHEHEPHDAAGGLHAHPHRHEPMRHAHPHAPDLHHRHSHD
jgi:drug/metabolite transporter (DMT)-like permease